MATRSERDKMFRRVLAGDRHALGDLISLEQPEIFDYLLRMTGEVNRSIEGFEQAVQELGQTQIQDLPSAQALRAFLFKRSRRALFDIWNADTTRLTNAALEMPKGDERLDERRINALQAAKAIDRSLRALPGPEREAVLLRVRYGFEFAHISELMGISESEIESLSLLGMQRVDGECSGQVTGPEDTLQKMPAHPLPQRSVQSTVNLSVVMEGIKAKPQGLRSPARLLFLLLLGSAMLVWVFFPDFFAKLSRDIAAFIEAKK